jgi:hypothetical protein
MPAEKGVPRRPAVQAALAAWLLLAGLASARPGEALPDYMRIDLKRLEETWNVLDRFADRIWPGWKGYAEVPFRFHYPNGVEMLVGHPSPTDGFEALPGVELRGKKVYLDRRREIPLDLAPPLSGGGGVIPFGKDRQVPIVDLHMVPVAQARSEGGESRFGEDAVEARPYESEGQVLVNIHELFHCYQRTVYHYRYGNLQYNPDANYAVYAEVEGLALENAYLDPDDAGARDALRDFLAARWLKRRSMTAEEANRESEDELMEGTAVYAETMALEMIRRGYRPLIGPGDDPAFHGFRDVDLYLKDKLDMLRRSATLTLDSRGKCYPYGCFQALLLTRLCPGWQATFFRTGTFLDRVIQDSLGMTSADIEAISERLKDRYPLEEIAARHGDLIRRRDAALATIRKRKGRTYVVNFKPLMEYIAPKGRGESYKLGLINIFPEGIETIEVRDVLFRGEKSPMVWDQLYYVKWVDPKARRRGYTLSYGRKAADGVYEEAELKTDGFVLRAPRIQVRELRDFVKITVLSKIRTPGNRGTGRR